MSGGDKEGRIKQFLADHCVEVTPESQAKANSFYPPVPLQSAPDGPLSGTGLILEMIPALARITVELDRGDQRRVNFQPGCPARVVLEQLTHEIIVDATTKAAQVRLIWLARLARHALEIADELHQFDGNPALAFAAGFVAGETCTADLFVGGEEELEKALDKQVFTAPHLGGRPFRLGFQTRRDQLRHARMADLDNL